MDSSDECCEEHDRDSDRELQVSVTPLYFTAASPKKSEFEIRNKKGCHIFFKLFTTNVHAVRYTPASGCIPPKSVIRVIAHRVLSAHPMNHHEELLVLMSSHPLREGQQTHSRYPAYMEAKEQTNDSSEEELYHQSKLHESWYDWESKQKSRNRLDEQHFNRTSCEFGTKKEVKDGREQLGRRTRASSCSTVEEHLRGHNDCRCVKAENRHREADKSFSYSSYDELIRGNHVRKAHEKSHQHSQTSEDYCQKCANYKAREQETNKRTRLICDRKQSEEGEGTSGKQRDRTGETLVKQKTKHDYGNYKVFDPNSTSRHVLIRIAKDETDEEESSEDSDGDLQQTKFIWHSDGDYDSESASERDFSGSKDSTDSYHVSSRRVHRRKRKRINAGNKQLESQCRWIVCVTGATLVLLIVTLIVICYEISERKRDPYHLPCFYQFFD